MHGRLKLSRVYKVGVIENIILKLKNARILEQFYYWIIEDYRDRYYIIIIDEGSHQLELV